MNESTPAHGSDAREHIKAITSRLLHMVDDLLDRMTPPARDVQQIAVRRRQAANTLRLWMFCDRSQCRRSHCCRGEPLHCMNIGVTLVPPGELDALLQRGKGGARRARSKARRAADELRAEE